MPATSAGMTATAGLTAPSTRFLPASWPRFVPAIRVLLVDRRKTWMPATSAGMTATAGMTAPSTRSLAALWPDLFRRSGPPAAICVADICYALGEAKAMAR